MQSSNLPGTRSTASTPSIFSSLITARIAEPIQKRRLHMDHFSAMVRTHRLLSVVAPYRRKGKPVQVRRDPVTVTGESCARYPLAIEAGKEPTGRLNREPGDLPYPTCRDTLREKGLAWQWVITCVLRIQMELQTPRPSPFRAAPVRVP